MNQPTPSPRSYIFDFPRLDTVVAVEAIADCVVIHVSRDTFSPARKACFLRELAAEGFIGEEFAGNWPGAAPVRWLVDPAEFLPAAASRAQTRRFMLQLFVSALGLWLGLMTLLWLHASR